MCLEVPQIKQNDGWHYKLDLWRVYLFVCLFTHLTSCYAFARFLFPSIFLLSSALYPAISQHAAVRASVPALRESIAAGNPFVFLQPKQRCSSVWDLPYRVPRSGKIPRYFSRDKFCFGIYVFLYALFSHCFAGFVPDIRVYRHNCFCFQNGIYIKWMRGLGLLWRLLGTRDSSVSIVTRQRAGPSGVRLQTGTRDTTLVRNVHNDTETHSAFCSTGAVGLFFSRSKVAGSWSSLATSIWCQG